MPIDVAEIVKKVRRIQIVASRQVDDLLAGEYRSVFKGRGMEFDAVREYCPGDDVRLIDWNVTARTGRPFIKRYAEERELTILFVVDISGSGRFGTETGSKLDVMSEVAALLMFSAQKNNDKVGMVLFADEVKAYYPPRKGRSAVRRLLRELVAIEPVRARTDLASALGFVRRVQRRRAVVFVISDFIDAQEYDRPLRILKARHDVIAITATDPRERELVPVGFVNFEDPETGEVCEVDTRHPKVRELFATEARQRSIRTQDRLRRSGVDRLPVSTDLEREPYVASLHRFFRARERR